MLKSTDVFQVEVVLNDRQCFCCNLLSAPQPANLIVAAKDLGAPTEICEALTFVQKVNQPAAGDSATTRIEAAGCPLGQINIVTVTVYTVPPKRGRKPKSAQPAPQTK